MVIWNDNSSKGMSILVSIFYSSQYNVYLIKRLQRTLIDSEKVTLILCVKRKVFFTIRYTYDDMELYLKIQGITCFRSYLQPKMTQLFSIKHLQHAHLEILMLLSVLTIIFTLTLFFTLYLTINTWPWYWPLPSP